MYPRDSARFSNRSRNCLGTERDSSIGWGGGSTQVEASSRKGRQTPPRHQPRHDGPTVKGGGSRNNADPSTHHLTCSSYSCRQGLSVTTVTGGRLAEPFFASSERRNFWGQTGTGRYLLKHGAQVRCYKAVFRPRNTDYSPIRVAASGGAAFPTASISASSRSLHSPIAASHAARALASIGELDCRRERGRARLLTGAELRLGLTVPITPPQ